MPTDRSIEHILNIHYRCGEIFYFFISDPIRQGATTLSSTLKSVGLGPLKCGFGSSRRTPLPELSLPLTQLLPHSSSLTPSLPPSHPPSSTL